MPTLDHPVKMQIKDIEQLYKRIKRFSKKLEQQHGEGAEWNYTFPDGQNVIYRITNVKSPEEIGDLVATLFIWVWSFKDYLKDILNTKGLSSQYEIEDIANNDRNLSICADIANGLKHGDLRGSRSKKFPVLGAASYSIAFDRSAPHNSIDSIWFTGPYVIINACEPNLIDIKIPIKDNNGNIICDAHSCLNSSISCWEAILDKIQVNNHD